MTTERILIIGDGIAGNTAAFTIRELNKHVNITVLSAENTYLYSACAFPNYLAREIPRDKVFLTDYSDYAKVRIDIILGCKVIRIDPACSEVVTETGRRPFDKLIIATGSKPLIPKIQGLDKQGVFSLKTLSDADSISGFPGKKAVVIGAGAIGLEVALALKETGYQVSVIECLEWMLPRLFDEKPSQLLRKAVEGYGVKVFTKEMVKKIKGNGRVQNIVTDRQEIKCDTVIIAAGMRPNIELAKEAGIRIGECGGIWVDEHMMTSIENIYACGDCVEAQDIITGRPSLSLLWHNAKEQGRVAGFNCIGLIRSYPGSLNVTGINIFGTHAVSIGRISGDLRGNSVEIVERTYGDDYRRLLIVDGRLVGIQTIGRSKHLGAFFSVMQRKEDISRIREAILNRKFGIVQLVVATNCLSGN